MCYVLWFPCKRRYMPGPLTFTFNLQPSALQRALGA